MLILIMLLWLMAGLGWLRFRDPLYPAVVQAVEWAVLFTLLWLLRDDFTPLHDLTLWVAGAGVVAFGMGAYVATFGHQPFRQANQVSHVPAGFPAGLLTLLVLAALLPVISRAVTMAAEGPFEEVPLANLRYALTMEEAGGGYGGWAYIFTLAYFAAALQLLSAFAVGSTRFGRLAWPAIVAAFFYGLLSSGRGTLLWLIVTLVMVPVVLRRVKVVGATLVFVLVALLIFASLGLMTGRGGQMGMDFQENVRSMALSLEVYLLSSLPALDQMLILGSPHEGGLNSLRGLFGALSGIGFEVPVRPLVQEYVEVPYLTNVYTLYQPYFLDFGVLALPCIQFVLGYGHGWLYRKATRPSPHPAHVFFFAVTFFPLLGQFWGDHYLSMISLWGQYLLWSALFLHAWARPGKQSPGRQSLAAPEASLSS